MKKTLAGILALSAIIFCAVTGKAGEPHYVSGVEGIKAATLPPPGLYGRLYGVYYHADTLRDDAGDKQDIGFDVKVFALVPRLIWISQMEVLGGNYFADVVVPIIKTDLSIDAAGIDDNKTGLGDICIEPLGISWHGARYDASVAAGGYVPSGSYDQNNAASPGKDMWTAMFTAGATVYADDERTLSASILSRYEIHSEKRDEDYTPGNDFHFEWGLGKTINRTIDVGLAGYCYWQLTNDRGDDSDSSKSRVFAVGPEISVFFPSQLMFLSARALWEFEARNQSEGMIGVLTLTKGF
ncbi:MAG: transporter [Kiritimatiellia bacterium]|nr:transporter [Lentisphaerota bacterium]